MPHLFGFLNDTGIAVGLRKGADGNLLVRPERERHTAKFTELMADEEEPPVLWFPRDVDPPARELSRFMAKMALEVFALRMGAEPTSIDQFIDSDHFDRLRNWARRGDNFDDWPVHQRQIFPEETMMRHPTTGQWVQAGFSYDIFRTRRREHFFGFCYYGHEFVINAGGPSIKGYEEWLSDNQRISPLVERVGGRLRQGMEDGRFYLEGSLSVGAGAEFDNRYAPLKPRTS